MVNKTKFNSIFNIYSVSFVLFSILFSWSNIQDFFSFFAIFIKSSLISLLISIVLYKLLIFRNQLSSSPAIILHIISIYILPILSFIILFSYFAEFIYGGISILTAIILIIFFLKENKEGKKNFSIFYLITFVAIVVNIYAALEIFNEKHRDIDLPKNQEIVMMEGDKIVAKTKIGTISIYANGQAKRTYEWNNCSETTVLQPRLERWYGSLGLYGGGIWKICDNTRWSVLGEGQQHFDTQEEAIKYIEKEKELNNDLSAYSSMDLIYSNDGLVIDWGFIPARNQINIEVWQIYIDGKKPSQLPGASDDSIEITKI